MLMTAELPAYITPPLIAYPLMKWISRNATVEFCIEKNCTLISPSNTTLLLAKPPVISSPVTPDIDIVAVKVTLAVMFTMVLLFETLLISAVKPVVPVGDIVGVKFAVGATDKVGDGIGCAVGMVVGEVDSVEQ
uniref:Uncharacterized protein n=1 Tax=Octactis speculum TaxID=3111310 RepID=A0A7S2BRT7_9STRA|mmetsp:Transcript_2647/g.3062  ORF Transcript_2647/g.3062 Transcript_2647/m.3062 type:complete len:134 (+) Transcript_2647:806-1207(+)